MSATLTPERHDQVLDRVLMTATIDGMACVKPATAAVRESGSVSRIDDAVKSVIQGTELR